MGERPYSKDDGVTDRPVRGAGHSTMRNFVGLWNQDGDDGFAVSPPNAALSFNEKTLIVTMADAEIVKTESGSQALKSTLILVKGKALTKLLQENKNLAAQVKRAAVPGMSNPIVPVIWQPPQRSASRHLM
jgi:hypothetical protein